MALDTAFVLNGFHDEWPQSQPKANTSFQSGSARRSCGLVGCEFLARNFLQGYAQEACKPPQTSSSTMVSHCDPMRLSQQANAKDGKAPAVQFCPLVSILPIPSRKDYSAAMRVHVWGSRVDRMLSERRNLLEFASEGFDWQQVVDDEDLLQDKEHPIHANPVRAAALLRELSESGSRKRPASPPRLVEESSTDPLRREKDEARRRSAEPSIAASSS